MELEVIICQTFYGYSRYLFWADACIYLCELDSSDSISHHTYKRFVGHFDILR